MNISPDLIQAIHCVWASIAPDAMEFCADNEEALEMCLDANRLQTFGYEKEEQELKDLIKQHGYTEVFCELNEQVSML